MSLAKGHPWFSSSKNRFVVAEETAELLVVTIAFHCLSVPLHEASMF
jgi:hypothetical protein